MCLYTVPFLPYQQHNSQVTYRHTKSAAGGGGKIFRDLVRNSFNGRPLRLFQNDNIYSFKSKKTIVFEVFKTLPNSNIFFIMAGAESDRQRKRRH